MGDTYFFDTVVLSNFAFSGNLNILALHYKNRLIITTEVFDEISKGISSGFIKLNNVFSLINDGIFTQYLLSADERNLYTALLKNLGSGEASCIASAKSINGIVVTDDKQARNCCRETGLRFTGTIGILKKLCISNSLNPNEADKILGKMIVCGFYSPVDKVSSIL